jgi:hypothetical protein
VPLHPEKKDALREEIAAYALEMAGTGVDLDPGLEAVGLAGLKAATERR